MKNLTQISILWAIDELNDLSVDATWWRISQMMWVRKWPGWGKPYSKIRQYLKKMHEENAIMVGSDKDAYFTYKGTYLSGELKIHYWKYYKDMCKKPRPRPE